MLAEGAAALAFAAYLAEPQRYQGQRNVVLRYGANFDLQVVQPIIAAYQPD